jgi:hypothetical protein
MASAASRANRIFRFGQFELSEGEGELRKNVSSAAPAHVVATWLTLSQEPAIRAPMRTRPADSCRS